MSVRGALGFERAPILTYLSVGVGAATRLGFAAARTRSPEQDLTFLLFSAMTSSSSEISLADAPNRPRASQRRSCSCESRAKWSHRTHLLCRSHPTTVAHRSTKSVGDLAARPQGGVGDVLRALGGGVVLESLVVAGAARREAREGSHGRRAGKRAPFGTSSIRRAHGRRRRRAEPIASLCNSREPIDARAGSCRRSGSWCI